MESVGYRVGEGLVVASLYSSREQNLMNSKSLLMKEEESALHICSVCLVLLARLLVIVLASVCEKSQADVH